MSPQFETPRLLIRPFRDCDLEPFLKYRNDPRVAEYQGWGVPFQRQKAIEFISEMKKATPGMPGEWYQFAIEHRDTHQLLGDMAFHVMQSNTQQACIGYTLAHDQQGHGYATEAVQRLLDYLFRELNLHRVVAECDVLNTASYQLLERMGFRREAHFVESLWFKGRWSSEYHYAILKREWLLR